MNLIYDVVLGLLLLSILYRSWRQGFIASFIRLAGTAAGFLVASFLSRPMAEKLYDGLLAKKVEAYVADTLLAPDSPLSSALAGLDQAGSAALHLVTQFLSERGLDFYTAGDAGEMGEKILSGILNGTDPAATVAQVVIKPMALTILCHRFRPAPAGGTGTKPVGLAQQRHPSGHGADPRSPFPADLASLNKRARTTGKRRRWSALFYGVQPWASPLCSS